MLTQWDCRAEQVFRVSAVGPDWRLRRQRFDTKQDARAERTGKSNKIRFAISRPIVGVTGLEFIDPGDLHSSMANSPSRCFKTSPEIRGKSVGPVHDCLKGWPRDRLLQTSHRDASILDMDERR